MVNGKVLINTEKKTVNNKSLRGRGKSKISKTLRRYDRTMKRSVENITNLRSRSKEKSFENISLDS